MATSASSVETENEPRALWQFILLAQFDGNRPQEPTQVVVRHGLQAVWSRLPFNRSDKAEPEIPEEALSLKSASVRLMDRAVPEPQWDRLGSRGLDEGLRSWLEQDVAVQAIVVAPFSGVDRMVRAWSQDHDIQILTPPSPADILAGNGWPEVFGEAGGANRRFILSGLENYYLRHPNGLNFVRRLLDLIWGKEISCLLTCDSWAWAYLNRVIHIESIFPAPLTLAPFDEAALAQWFRELAGHHASLEPIFREATTGRAVLASSGSSSDDQAETEGGKKTDREFLTHLAARSRGNPGVARAIWRASLQVNSDEDVEAKAQEEAAEDKGYTMWVNPLPKINLPSLPSGSSREEALVLHALLLHNGLSAPLLSELLPLGHETVLQIVHRLRTARLVTDADECWQVVPLGYPAVRAFLDREGFLIDVL